MAFFEKTKINVSVKKNSGFIDSRLGVPSDEADKIFAKFVN